MKVVIHKRSTFHRSELFNGRKQSETRRMPHYVEVQECTNYFRKGKLWCYRRERLFKFPILHEALYARFVAIGPHHYQLTYTGHKTFIFFDLHRCQL